VTVRQRDGSFLGCGWSFPPTFDAQAGSVHMVADDADIQQSLAVLFSTLRRERVMLPDFGCGLSEFVFDSVDSALFARIKATLANAILLYEPRINVGTIDVTAVNDTDGLLQIALSYTIRTTNTRSNMVYPFYLQGEGTNVRRIG
jgi:phage baseplate assembly protein W